MVTRRRAAPAVSAEETGEDQHDVGGQGWAVPAASHPLHPRVVATLPEIEDTESPLDRILTVLGEQADPARDTRISLYRLPKVGPREWCQDFEQHELQEGWGSIRGKWGAGTYEFRVFGYRSGETRFVLLNRTVIVLAPTPESFGFHGQPAPAPVVDNQLAAVLGQLAQGQQAIVQALAQRPDPAKELAGTLALFTQMKTLFGPPEGATPQKSTIGELVDAIKELREAGDLVGGGSDRPKSTAEQLVELAQPLLGLVRDQLAARQGAQAAPIGMIPAHSMPGPFNQPIPQLTVPGDPGPALNPPTTPPPMTDQPAIPAMVPVVPIPADEAQAVAQLQQHLADLIAQARADGPIDVAAEFVYVNLPDELLEVLETSLWWQGLITYAPDVAPHQTWFTAVREAVLRMLAEDGEEGDATPP